MSFKGVERLMPLPQRVSSHVIDSQASMLVPALFPAETWIIRDVTERDFGVDKIVERFENGYATSEIMMLQIKGTENTISSNHPKFSLKTKTLLYAEMFAVPFLLLYCSITPPYDCYYIWLQEYIKVRLNYENPSWRNQATNTVYFPMENKLGTTKAQNHLTYISGFPKYQTSWVGYYLQLNDLCYNFLATFEYDSMKKKEIDDLINPVISKLENGLKKAVYIPKRFIPDCYTDTIELGKSILNSPQKPAIKSFFQFISNCQQIQGSVDLIALRFDESYLRTLYEIEGTADF